MPNNPGEHKHVYSQNDTDLTDMHLGDHYFDIDGNPFIHNGTTVIKVPRNKADVGLNLVDNIRKEDLPVSTPQQQALDAKLDDTYTIVPVTGSFNISASHTLPKLIKWDGLGYVNITTLPIGSVVVIYNSALTPAEFRFVGVTGDGYRGMYICPKSSIAITYTATNIVNISGSTCSPNSNYTNGYNYSDRVVVATVGNITSDLNHLDKLVIFDGNLQLVPLPAGTKITYFKGGTTDSNITLTSVTNVGVTLSTLQNNHFLSIYWKTNTEVIFEIDSSQTVDLSGYVTTGSLTSTLSNYVAISALASYVTTSALTSALNNYTTTSALNTLLSSYVTSSSLNTTLGGYTTSSALATALSAYVSSTTFNNTLVNYVTSTSLSSTLSSYVTSTALSNALASYVASATLNITLASYVTTSSLNSILTSYLLASVLAGGSTGDVFTKTAGGYGWSANAGGSGGGSGTTFVTGGVSDVAAGEVMVASATTSQEFTMDLSDAVDITIKTVDGGFVVPSYDSLMLQFYVGGAWITTAGYYYMQHYARSDAAHTTAAELADIGFSLGTGGTCSMNLNIGDTLISGDSTRRMTSSSYSYLISQALSRTTPSKVTKCRLICTSSFTGKFALIKRTIASIGGVSPVSTIATVVPVPTFKMNGDGGATDLTTGSATITAYGGIASTANTLLGHGAFLFDGSNDSIKIQGTAISAMIQAAEGNLFFMVNDPNVNNSGYGICWGKYSDMDSHYSLVALNTSSGIRLDIANSSGGTVDQTFTESIPSGWHVVRIKFTTNTVSVYVDGVLKGTNTVAMWPGSDTVTLGALIRPANTAGVAFEAIQIAEVRGFNALTSNEVAAVESDLNSIYRITSTGTELLAATAATSQDFATDLSSVTSFTLKSVNGGFFGSGSNQFLKLQFFVSGDWVTTGYIGSRGYFNTVTVGQLPADSTGVSLGYVNTNDFGTVKVDVSIGINNIRCLVHSGAGANGGQEQDIYASGLNTSARPTKCRLITSSGTFTGQFELAVNNPSSSNSGGASTLAVIKDGSGTTYTAANGDTNKIIKVNGTVILPTLNLGTQITFFNTSSLPILVSTSGITAKGMESGFTYIAPNRYATAIYDTASTAIVSGTTDIDSTYSTPDTWKYKAKESITFNTTQSSQEFSTDLTNVKMFNLYLFSTTNNNSNELLIQVRVGGVWITTSTYTYSQVYGQPGSVAGTATGTSEPGFLVVGYNAAGNGITAHSTFFNNTTDCQVVATVGAQPNYALARACRVPTTGVVDRIRIITRGGINLTSGYASLELISASMPNQEVLNVTAGTTVEFGMDISGADKIKVEIIGDPTTTSIDGSDICLQMYSNGAWVTSAIYQELQNFNRASPGGGGSTAGALGNNLANGFTVGANNATGESIITLGSTSASSYVEYLSTYQGNFYDTQRKGRVSYSNKPTRCRLTIASGTFTGKFKLTVM